MRWLLITPRLDFSSWNHQLRIGTSPINGWLPSSVRDAAGLWGCGTSAVRHMLRLWMVRLLHNAWPGNHGRLHGMLKQMFTLLACCVNEYFLGIRNMNEWFVLSAKYLLLAFHLRLPLPREDPSWTHVAFPYLRAFWKHSFRREL